jgi:hypothetical protein
MALAVIWLGASVYLLFSFVDRFRLIGLHGAFAVIAY